MSTVFERATVGLVEVDAGVGAITAVNPAACALFGRGREALHGLGFAELFVRADRGVIEAALADARSGRELAFSRELRLQTSDGCVSWVNVDLVAACATGDRVQRGRAPTAVVATLVDVTGHKMVEDALTSSSVYAEAANRSKTEFLARTSHELRTPLSALLGYAEVLASRLHEPDNLSCLETIKRSGRHLLGLVDDLLDLSRIESGHLALEEIEFSPQELLREVLRLFEVRAAQRGLELRTVFDGPVPALIRSDPMRLRQILVNLIGNAIKFTDQGHVCVTLSARQRDGRPTLEFAVSDTGIGIADEHLANLFEPFRQAEPSVSRRFGGTGLGLSISQHLVGLLGGAITVDSSVGRGSTFCFSVDLGNGTSGGRAAGNDLASAVVPTGLPRDALLGHRVLVAERDPHVCRAHRRTLERTGAWVQTVSTLSAVFDHLERAARCEQPFDALLIDVDLIDRALAPGRLEACGFHGVTLLLCAHGPCDPVDLGLSRAAVVLEPVMPGELLATLVGELAIDRSDMPEDGEDEGEGASDPELVSTALIVAHDRDLALSVSLLVEMLGYRVDIAHDTATAIELVVNQGPHDVVLLNLEPHRDDPVVDTLASHVDATRLVALVPEHDPHPSLADQVARCDAWLAAPIDFDALALALGRVEA